MWFWSPLQESQSCPILWPDTYELVLIHEGTWLRGHQWLWEKTFNFSECFRYVGLMEPYGKIQKNMYVCIYIYIHHTLNPI